MRFVPNDVLRKTGFDVVLRLIQKHIYTPYGRALVIQLHPESSREAILMLRNQTAELQALNHQDHQIPLFRIDDIREWLDQARPNGTVLPLEAFPLIREHIRLTRVISSFFGKHKNESPVLFGISSGLQQQDQLESEINRLITDEGKLKNDASPHLKSIRKELHQKKEGLRSTIQRIYKKSASDGMASDEGPTLRSGRMVIPILAEFKRKIDGFIHDVSSSGQTVYLEPAEALQINNDIRQLEAEEAREIERILRELTRHVRSSRSALIENSDILGEIDLIHARCKASEKWRGALPDVSKGRKIHIVNGVNPVLYLKHHKRSSEHPEAVIPLNLTMSDQETALVISGPNAGGKSVALKTVALLVSMHQCGIPIPADPDSTLPICSGIFLDMGDDQSIENDLSTFSSRLKWMFETITNLDTESIVLIDEAGTGTDPDEGGALFQAFIETCMNKGATTLATTHHGGLKVFAHDHPNMVNGSMEFNQKTLSPTYLFRKGVPGSSYAFEIAERMNIPENILDRARSLLGEKRDRMGNLLLDLEAKLTESEKAKNNYEKQAQDLKEREKRYRNLYNELEGQRKEKLEKAYSEAERVLKKANQKIEQAVEKISMQNRYDAELTQNIRKDIDQHKEKIRSKLTEVRRQHEKKQTNDQPVIGDLVKLQESDYTGELVESDGTHAVVLVGKMKIRTRLDQLYKAENQKRNNDKSKTWMTTSSTTILSDKQISTTLNIRGNRGNEAINKVMHYLDHAVAVRLEEVDIIHGKGEGILKELVHDHLNQRDDIEDFDIAPLERGGAGCTIVKLK